MLRRIAAVLTLVALLGGAWGVRQWLDNRPPPLGEIPLEAITPPNTTLQISSHPWCSQEVPGFMAYGESSLNSDEVKEWFDNRYGPEREQVTARRNYGVGDGTYSIYDDVAVWIRGSDSGTALRVQTYDTTSHDCPWRESEIWEGRDAWSMTDACSKPFVEFWGIEYGGSDAGDPPTDSTIKTFADGRAIAYFEDDLSVIYARIEAGSGWLLLRAGDVCGSM